MLFSVLETCTPRPEILSGDLSFDLFAAKLRLVVEGNAPNIYQNPELFFANTFVTDGLRELIREVFGRLSGAVVGSPVIRLETSFGGGKTHDEIALWHLAKRGRSLFSGDDRFVDDLLLIPDQPIQVAAVDGRDLSPEEGVFHRETGITTKTIWGEIAYQIRGIEGYDLLKGSDTSGVSPGTAVLEQLIRDRPTLIILDEIARYLSSAKAKRVGDSNLAKQVVAFLFSLMDCAASCQNLVLVYSLASSTDTFADETEQLKRDLDSEREIRSASARQERILRPSNDVEIYNIVKQRMFSSISLEAAEKAADRYFESYRASRNDLPEGCKELSYRAAIANSYPFHPELFNLLTQKIASIPDFQRTRGALRLFAQVVRYLWQHPAEQMSLIHPHHLPIGMDSEITSDLTFRLQRPLMDLPIKADIYNATGTPAHAQTQDQEWRDGGKPPFSSWVARTIFLHSLTQGITAGIRRSELNLSLVSPTVELGFADRALDNLVKVGWHIDLDPVTAIAQFKEEPSINKIIAQEKSQVLIGAVKEELRKRRDSYFAKKFFDAVIDPNGAYDVDDRPDSIALCLMDFDEVTIRQSTDSAPPKIEQIFNNTGDSGKFRVFRNRLLFLLANDQELEQTIDRTREYLAVKTLRQSPRRLEELSESQQKELKGKEGDLDLAVRIALTNTYRHLFYPSQDPVKAPNGLMHYTLPTQDSSTVKGKNNQQEVILKVLKDCSKIRPDDAKPFAPAYILHKVWSAGIDRWTTKALREAFAKNINLNMLLEGELSKLRETIKTGVTEGAWDLKMGQQVYIAPLAPQIGGNSLPMIEFSERLEIYRRGILKPPEPKVIQFDVAVVPCNEVEKTARLIWKAKGAIAVALYKENELIRNDYLPSDHEDINITSTTSFKLVADYGEAGTGEQTAIAYFDAKPATGTGGTDQAEPLFLRQSETTTEGSPNKACIALRDWMSDQKVTTISSLTITVDTIQDYRRLGTAIALLSRYQPHIEQSVTLQCNGQFTRLEYQGDLRGFQGFSAPLNLLFNAPEVQGNAMLRIRLEFLPQPRAVTDGFLEEIKGALNRNPVDRLQLTAQVGYD
ncbi:ATP-binding protein [Synechococcus moorigangaii CMS01]|nr:ATP-binding protein [Synechococcus moorigangaii CMS01]